MPRTTGTVHSINTSRGGVPKLPVESAWIDAQGVEGDAQADRKHHGGPDRAVCLFSLEVIETVAREGHAIFPGSTGENVTVAGLDWDLVRPGAVIAIGGVELEVTDYTAPCKTIAGSFEDRAYKRISQKVHPGSSRVYARVRQPGLLRAGDEVTIRQTEGDFFLF
jgi:MOSC domain-containing protein YiiM